MYIRKGLESMRKGHFAFYCEQLSAETLITQMFTACEMCDTKQTPFRRDYPAGIIVNKFSPFRERFLLNWLWIRETGISDKVMKHWRRSKITCDSRAHYSSVRIEYVSSAFLILLTSHILSIIILLCEIAILRIN